jgi:HSP20 family molecular chaperone IbpA
VRARSQVSGASGGDAVKLQREANDQAVTIQNQINQINQEGQQNEDRLKQQYGQDYAAEGVREEAAIESEKTKGYERLRALQRQYQSDEKRIQMQGEEAVAGIKDQFQTETSRARMNGAQELTETQTRNTQLKDFEEARGKSEYEMLKKDNTDRTATLSETNNERLAKLGDDYRKQYEQKKATTELATEQATKKIIDRHNHIVGEQLQAENKIAHEANRQLENLRASTAKKLSAYQERQSDPFYKMVTLNTQLTEEPDRYVLYASVPEFEQPNVKVSFSGDKLILAGQRRNEEKLDLGQGRAQSTSSFQSFSESFPILGPVEANELTRETIGDTLKITIPKKAHAFTQAKPFKSDVHRLALEKPHFPAHLPHVDHDDAPQPKAEIASSSSNGENRNLLPADPSVPGSGTLTLT